MRLVNLCILAMAILLADCSGCSRSGKLHKQKGSGYVNRASETRVKMQKKNGVFQIPITINGTEMYFIFDTGAGLISISNVEVTFLYKQGQLTPDDILGSADFMDANGDILEGVILNLREVAIGNRKLNNVKAVVVNSAKAPLLLGQSALEQFGKISIDYEKAVIIFE
jgi:aspartyl protease family protein